VTSGHEEGPSREAATDDDITSTDTDRPLAPVLTTELGRTVGVARRGQLRFATSAATVVTISSNDRVRSARS
jgi:hypothetical protein